MRVLITGARGMLAQAVKEKFATDTNGQMNELILTDVDELDITNAQAVREFVLEKRPEIIINCAAYTNVDGAEEQEALAYKINAEGPGNLAMAAKANDSLLIHISTDYVFGGGLDTLEEYSEDDEKAPRTAYGRTKLAGEEKIVESGCKYYIFRTAWLYGDGPNFVRTMLKVGREREIVEVVSDQYGSPTYAEDLADIIYQAVAKNIPLGIYNATNLGYTTWAEFTREIYTLAGVDCIVRGITSEKYARGIVDRAVAERPKNSKLSKQKLINEKISIPEWKDGLKRYLKKEKQNEK